MERTGSRTARKGCGSGGDGVYQILIHTRFPAVSPQSFSSQTRTSEITSTSLRKSIVEQGAYRSRYFLLFTFKSPFTSEGAPPFCAPAPLGEKIYYRITLLLRVRTSIAERGGHRSHITLGSLLWGQPLLAPTYSECNRAML